MRLSPRDPLMHEFLFTIASAHFQAGRLAEAVDCVERSLSLNTDQPSAWRVLAASQALLGNEEEAKRALKQLLRLAPELDAEQLTQRLGEEYAARTVEALRKVGWTG